MYRCTLATFSVVSLQSKALILSLLIEVALNCIHDLILTFLPIVILKDLNITQRVKVILGVLMSMSIL
jgi:hypothetical protein